MSTSSLRVFVDWTQSTVFAGEEIQCQITFKNVASLESTSKETQVRDGAGGIRDQAFSKSPNSASLSPVSASQPLDSSRITKHGSRHRSVKSLNLPAPDMDNAPHASKLNNGYYQPDRPPVPQRSIAVTSIGLSPTAGDENGCKGMSASRLESRKPSINHTRAMSLQTFGRPAMYIENRRPSGSTVPHSVTPKSLVAVNPSVPFDRLSSHEPMFATQQPSGPRSQLGDISVDNADAPARSTMSGNGSTRLHSPSTSCPLTEPVVSRLNDLYASEDDDQSSQVSEQSRSKHIAAAQRDRMVATKSELHTQQAQYSSNALMEGTPKSSGELFSTSNPSAETLTSAYTSPNSGGAAPLPQHNHRPRSHVDAKRLRLPETLMMAYAQTVGTFSVDGSLVNQTLFDDVKKKATTSNQGGGVLGLRSSRWQSSLIRGFGLGNLGVSINSLLGGSELSSIREARGAVNARNVPLLSTPQTILFVDLKLAPGEARSFHYAVRLPKGLPPSHRGKVIKIWYKLVVGIQRQGAAKEHQMHSIEFPFRLLGTVNRYGEVLGHDLLSPYILLREQAHSQLADSKDADHEIQPVSHNGAEMLRKGQLSRSRFLAYVDDLLAIPQRSSSLGLQSPTQTQSRRNSTTDTMLRAKETIDAAIQRSNHATGANQSANRFEIMSNSQRIAVITLARPSYRLGETVTAVVDFTEAQIPSYAIHTALETNEIVDPAIALRSEASISRVTRKLFAKHTESTLYAQRIIFAPTIPFYATPTFITSAVCLDWKLVFEFAIPRQVRDASCKDGSMTHLLEACVEDERAVFLAAVDRLDCESFEVALPLRVYGAVPTEPEDATQRRGIAV